MRNREKVKQEQENEKTYYDYDDVDDFLLFFNFLINVNIL